MKSILILLLVIPVTVKHCNDRFHPYKDEGKAYRVVSRNGIAGKEYHLEPVCPCDTLIRVGNAIFIRRDSK